MNNLKNNIVLSFKLFFCLLAIISIFEFFEKESFSQVNTEWIARFNGPGINMDFAKVIALDLKGNVFVSGEAKYAGSGGDITTLKYSNSGVLLWVATIPGTGGDEVNTIAVDSSGNVYVGGSYALSGIKWEYILVKYNPQGVKLWQQVYVGSNYQNKIMSMALDNFGYIYVTGSFDQNCATIKYDTAGAVQWIRSFSSAFPYALKLDSASNVYITGTSNFNYWTIKYDSAGAMMWTDIYNGPGNDVDVSYALALDHSANVYITGSSRRIPGGIFSADYATIKYNSSGVRQWVQRYNGPMDFIDVGTAICTDALGNIFVTGTSGGYGSDYYTIKYNPDGVEQWAQRYNGSTQTNSPEDANAMAIDLAGNIYVTGKSGNDFSSEDFATVKYNTNGVQIWVARYDVNVRGKYDEAYAIAVDRFNNVYVCGTSDSNTFAFRDYCTIKYSQVTGTSVISGLIPVKFSLSQNYPNPFNPTTKIKFDVPKPSFTKLIIYDMLGREVTTLVNEELKPGTYETDWDASYYSSGVYFYKIISGDFVETKKMVLMR